MPTTTFKKLLPVEFETALRQGRGQAFLHVRHWGLTDIADRVLASCLKNTSYDPQCEPSRSAWLFSLFKDSAEVPRFSAAIQAALQQTALDGQSFDLQQQCELLSLLAQNGDEAAGNALRDYVLGPEASWSEWPFCCPALTALDGAGAVIELARRFGKALKDTPKETPLSISDMAENIDKNEIEATLSALSHTDKNIKRYLNALPPPEENNDPELTLKERKQALQEAIRSQLTLEGILAHAALKKECYPFHYRRFGRYATAEELNTLLQHLLAEPDEAVCLRLLWVFSDVPLPETPPRILAWLNHPNLSLRTAAIEALAHCRDPQIGEIGRKKLRSGNFSADEASYISLLTHSFQPQDVALILSALTPLSLDADGLHHIGGYILGLCETHCTPSVFPLLLWLYETTPCTVCRHAALSHMANLGNVPPDIIAESLYDANQDIQYLAENILEKTALSI